MGWTSLSETKVSKKPALAPKDYKKLKPCVIIMDGASRACRGSGVPLDKIPIFRDPWQENYSNKCGNCKSDKTLCIFADCYSDMVGKSDNYELECKDCKMFTVYSYVD